MRLFGRPPRQRYVSEPLEQRRLLSSGGWDIALIDKTLPAEHVLERAMVGGGRVILYDGRRESPHEVLSRVLEWADDSGCKIQSVSLLSHASAGRFALGNEWISKSSVDEIATDLKRLGDVFCDDGRINVYGCNLVDRLGDGQALINKIAGLTHVPVFASDDLTGRGGDWVLEASSISSSDKGLAGGGRATSPFSTKLLAEWPGTLSSAGVTVSPTSGLVTTENGGTATFTIKLNTNPGGSATVSIGLSSSNITEGTVSPTGVTFNNSNWNTPQTVTITGVNDALVDGNVAYSIITAPAVSSSASYNGLDPADVSVTNIDNDTPGITVNPSSGLTTTEAGGTASFTVQLNNPPSANVTIPLSSSDTSEGTLSVASLMFTSANWNTPQTVTITGVDDFEDDGDIGYSIVTGAAISSDANYNGLDGSDVSVTNSDNDTAGITVSPTSGLVTTEAGGATSFTIVLNSQPLANVVLGLSSSNTGEGTISASSLTFTPANWNTPQTITITGADDFVADGNVAYSVVTAPASSSDALYNGLNPSDVSVTNNDNDTAGFTVSPTSGLTTTEAGGTASFSVALTSQPTANVSVGVSSSNTAEGTISVASLLFTAANWNVAQTVTITGVDDFVDDGDLSYSVVTAAATSADPNYNGRNPSDVSVTNIDNDTAGINVSPTSGLITTEAGGSASFTVVLTSQPTGNVTIPLSSSKTGEGSISASSLIFTTANWNTPQSVMVSGVDDFVDDGDIAYTIATGAATSSDANYSGRDAADVSVTNVDDDTAGITVSPTSGLTTTEAGGAASFTVVLNSKPTANVSIGISSSNTGEGTVSTSLLTFTAANWNAPQTVTVTGANDFVDDGNVSYSIVTAAAASADANYNGRNAADVSATNTDDDTAGITVSPTSGLVTTEAGGTASFSVVLASQPTADVVINLNSSNTAEGTVSASSLTFTPATWNTPQMVTITGVDDHVDDGDIAFSVVTSAATSADSNYSGMNPPDVSVTNTDDDTAGVTVSPSSGLTTTEAGGTASFTIALNSQPTANVTIALSSSNTAEGTISTSSVTLTPANWNTPQTVTITGADDLVDDGDIAYSVVTAAAASSDSKYSGLNAADVSVTNLDNDTAGITVTPVSGLVTTEAGGAASFTVVLDSKPTANVVIGISSSNTAEGTVSAASLTFTAANWNTPQTITVTGVDDSVDDGDIAYTVVTAAAASADASYNGMNAADVAVTNSDDDTAAITVSPTSGLSTTEAGATASFTVVLASQPTANVSIGLSSSNTAEGTVAPASLVFTPANWNIAQTVTATGVDDLVDDGDVAYTIVTAAATSTDPNYNGRNAADVSVTNVDNDTAGIMVTPTSGLVTSEAGGSEDFTIALNSQPVANVTIPLTSSNSGEGSLSVSSVTFTAANWNTPQTVTVTGVDDFIDDGDMAFNVVTGAATSSDASYSGMNAADVSLTNTDNDTAGVTVTPTTGLVTTEAGGADSFSVVLNSQPTANVLIDLSSSNTGEGVPSTSRLTFTAANWNVPQVVTVTGVDDAVDDDDIAYSIVTAAASSADANYNGMAVADVSATNVDNDTAGFTFTPASGLTTTEAGGTATFTIVLNSRPTSSVTLGLSSSDTTEGAISAASVTFTSANWNVAQTVTVTGVDDFVSDGNVSFDVVTAAATSTDPKYSALNPADVSVTNVDNDTAGITVTPTTGVVTTEAGGTAAFSVQLNTQPTADVVINLSSSNVAEGTISASSLTFTSANWNTPQTVTITGVDDDVDDGDVAYSIVTSSAASADPNYSAMAVPDVSVTNQDNDTAGVSITPTSGLVTTEAGGAATFSAVLTSRPTANVTFSLGSSNLAEGTLSASSLTFTSANWNIAQILTLTGQDDAIDDGNVAYTVTTGAVSSADPGYNGLNPADVSATNVDDDQAGITVSPTSGLITTEAGATANFTVVLTSQPTANVTIPLSSSNTGEGSVSASSLVFTAANWNTPQTVTVTGVNDLVDDGDIAYSITTAAATSADSNYNGMNSADVSVTNTDNDTAGITVSPTSGLLTSEAGATANFTIALNSQPTANVTIPLSSSNTAEGTLSVSTVTFTAANWNAPQTVTITGVDDFVDDGDIGYSVVTGAATSGDANYSGMNAADASATNVDNDTAGIVVTPTSGLTTTESGSATSFSIVLASKPTADVTIGVSSSNSAEGTVSVASLTFTAADWNVPQSLTVTGADDSFDDGDIAYTIVTAAATSGDGNYNGMNPSDVSVTNIDNDTAGISVSPTSGLTTTEAGAAATFDVVLTSKPTANVTFALSSDHTSEGVLSVASLTFTPANWNVTQTVTVTGVDDLIDDGDIAYNIVTAAATSADPNYSSLNPANVALTNLDDDTAGITVSPTSGLTTTEAGGSTTFTIVLNSQPTANVTIPLSSSNSGEGTASSANVTFTASNWNVAQTVTITGVDDLIDDGDVGYSIVTGAATSADPKYSGLNASDVSVTNTDNDTADVIVSPTSGLTTTEAGGNASFTIVLASRPTASVTIGIASSNLAEGVPSASSVTFTSANWNTPQTITVTGVDDAVDDGDAGYSIVTAAATSGDPNYSGMNPSDVTATNIDNDTAGITVSPTSGLVTTEAGATASFSIVLTSQPTADVTIPLSSSNTGEGTLSAASVTFTSANWNTPQTVTVTGVNDSVDDGNVAYSIVTGAAVSADGNYGGLNAADVSLTNTDNDTAGITVSPTSGLITTEAGGSASFTLVLDSEPTADVTISLSSSNTGEGSVSTGSVTFTAGNWNTPQTITITGVDDAIDDGDIAYSVVTASATSADANYNGRNAADVAVTNVDDDTAGITISPTSGLTTTEAGGTATFTVVLTSKPTANVTIPLSSSNTAEGTVSAASVVFTPSNWNTPQVVTISGVDDPVDDGDINYSVVTAAATSIDANYTGRNPSDVSVRNLDDDVAGITVTPTSGLVTTEAGGATSFTIALTSRPTANVVIGLASSKTTEGTLSLSSLTFTPANWNTPQTVTVTGADDLVDDGDVSYSIVTAAAVSSDAGYSGLNAADVSITNTDNDTAGFTVTPTSGLVTTEAGGNASFTVALTSKPTADVTIALSSSNPGEATLSVSTLVFTAANWDIAQTVTLTGVDDDVADGNVAYSVITTSSSGDAIYNSLDPADVSASNLDDDFAGITVTPSTGLTTTEAGGTATFTIVLDSQPSADVTIPISSSDTTEGTVSTALLTFTPADWYLTQTVTVRGVDDLVSDGDVSFSIVTGAAASADPAYNGLASSDVTATNSDDDVAEVHVTPVAGLVTTEAGGTASFSIVLTSQPTSTVTINLSSSNPQEGTLSANSVTFDATDWSVPHVVTITGVDDNVQDGDTSYTLITAPAVSADPVYGGINGADVSATNLDNDVAGVTVTPVSALTTSESGGTAQFSVVLDAQPSANVRIPISSSRPGEAALAISRLTFTPSNWNVPQIVTVSGVDDSRVDGDQTFSIALAPIISADPHYNGINPADVAGTNLDNDVAGFLVTPTTGLVTRESGGSTSFTVVLQSEPSANVTLGVSSSNTAEGTVSASNLTFTPANWNVPQRVTVTGVDDALRDGDIGYAVALAPAASTDGDYNGVDPADVALTNIDNDTIGIAVVPTAGLTTSEIGTSISFSIALTKQPSGSTTVSIQSSNTAEGIASRSTLSFTPDNWDIPRTITVSGVNDLVDDGDVHYDLIVSVSSSADVDYAALAPKRVTLTNTDDDTAGVTVTPVTSAVTTESDGAASFDIVLNSQPVADVALVLNSRDRTEGSLARSTVTLTFTPANWDRPQRVTVRGLDDHIVDGDVLYRVLLRPGNTNADPKYASIRPQSIYLTNLDNDAAGFSITPVGKLTTSESGDAAQFDVVLKSQPTDNVVLSLASTDRSEGRVLGSTLTFTPADWNVPQRVTVRGVDDAMADGDREYQIIAEVASTTTDPDYASLSAQSIQLTNSDNDVAGLAIEKGGARALITTEAGGAARFTVSLSSQPTSDVELTVTSSDTTEGTVSVSKLFFTPTTWNAPQTITLHGVDDATDDGDAAYHVTIAPAHSADPIYAALAPVRIDAVNTDDDTFGIVVVPSARTMLSKQLEEQTFAVRLGSQPQSDVLVAPTLIGLGGTLSTHEIRFSPQNWDQPQFVTFVVPKGTEMAGSSFIATATSSDPQYDGFRSAEPLRDGGAHMTVSVVPALSPMQKLPDLEPLDLGVMPIVPFAPHAAATAPPQLPSSLMSDSLVIPSASTGTPDVPATAAPEQPQNPPAAEPSDPAVNPEPPVSPPPSTQPTTSPAAANVEAPAATDQPVVSVVQHTHSPRREPSAITPRVHRAFAAVLIAPAMVLLPLRKWIHKRSANARAQARESHSPTRPLRK